MGRHKLKEGALGIMHYTSDRQALKRLKKTLGHPWFSIAKQENGWSEAELVGLTTLVEIKLTQMSGRHFNRRDFRVLKDIGGRLGWYPFKKEHLDMLNVMRKFKQLPVQVTTDWSARKEWTKLQELITQNVG